MAFTTPATAVAGTVLTASWLNTYVRDNVAWMATDSPAARAYNSANLSTTTGVATALTLNSERFDNAAVHDTGSNTSRMTIPTGGGGKYIIGGGVTWASSALGAIRNSFVLLNGATILVVEQREPSAATNSQSGPCTTYALADADYVELIAQQDSTGNLNVNVAGNYSPEFWVLWTRT